MHNNPVNNVDPTGKMSIATVGVTMAIGATVAALFNVGTNYALGNPLQTAQSLQAV